MSGPRRFPWFNAASLALFTLWGCGGSTPPLTLELDGADSTDAPLVLSWDADDPPEEQLPALRERSTRFGREPFWPCELGRQAIRLDSLRLAETAFRDALERDPLYVPAASQRAALLFETARHEMSLEEIAAFEERTTAAGRPWPAELELARAIHLAALGRHDGARESLARAPRLRSHGGASLDAHTFAQVTAYVTLLGETPRSAREPARDAVSADPRDAINLNNAGIASLLEGDPTQARDAFLRAHEVDPELPGPLYNLAITDHFYFFDAGAAREWFDRYLALSGDDPDNLRQVLGEGMVQRSSSENHGSAP